LVSTANLLLLWQHTCSVSSLTTFQEVRCFPASCINPGMKTLAQALKSPSKANVIFCIYVQDFFKALRSPWVPWHCPQAQMLEDRQGLRCLCNGGQCPETWLPSEVSLHWPFQLPKSLATLGATFPLH
jgi:hypothetical protein